MDIVISPQNQAKLKELGVQALYLFGSRAMGTAHPLSDFDFAVLRDVHTARHSGEMYDALYDILSPLCPRTLENDAIDIVFLDKVSLELRMHVVRYGKVLYDNDPRSRVNFEEKTVIEYADFKPILDMFDQTILASL